ncbi:FAD-dependent oxidoreductase [Georgenia satyanarayanai]|uniref:FAD-dependent oxidoreductase n=1 Tax=Georgenia satyanarayanai TaxID=860221 RepID=UPI00203E75DE|nr:FAD-dependent oxidoreductase [Georgenia satyanarayanai]MCM3661511.1 FAD-dependent oxidoreductase [Georgenia satyanarayanai]
MALPRTRLLERNEIADDTMVFSFEKPPGFEYTAGQFADYTLLDPAEIDAEGATRGFSLTSAPYEPHLMAATRLRDTAFKRVLKTMPLGTELALDAPYGSFTLHHNVGRPAVFLTGGIGITPVRSIALQAAHDRTGHKIIVLYSNKRPEEAAFLAELRRLGETEENFTLVPTMTRPETSEHSWDGETGHVDKAMLSRYIDDVAAPIYYLSGPATMVTAMRTVLNDVGVDADDLRTEEFTGY